MLRIGPHLDVNLLLLTIIALHDDNALILGLLLSNEKLLHLLLAKLLLLNRLHLIRLLLNHLCWMLPHLHDLTLRVHNAGDSSLHLIGLLRYHVLGRLLVRNCI